VAAVVEGPGAYYIGIVDMLQDWDVPKRFENLWKASSSPHERLSIRRLHPVTP
jgi:hypothetical protein